MESPSRGQAALELGESARRNGRIPEARNAFADAIDAFRNDGDIAGEARALSRQAQVARDTGHIDWALHDQIQAIALYRRIGDGALLAHALRHAADMFVAQDKLPHATAYLHEAMDLYRVARSVPPLDVANAMRSVALLAEALRESSQARTYWQQARDHYAVLDVQAGVLEADRHIALIDG